MEERHLLIIAFFVSFLGISVIYVVTQFIAPAQPVALETAYEEDVVIKGQVEEVTVHESMTFLTVSYTVPVVIFKKVDVTQGRHVEITGKVEKYEGKPELIAKHIKESPGQGR